MTSCLFDVREASGGSVKMSFRVQFPLDKKIKTQQIITDAWITIVQKSEVSEHFLKEVSPSLHLFYKNIQFKKQ